jgi:hypothetical protein
MDHAYAKFLAVDLQLWSFIYSRFSYTYKTEHWSEGLEVASLLRTITLFQIFFENLTTREARLRGVIVATINISQVMIGFATNHHSMDMSRGDMVMHILALDSVMERVRESEGERGGDIRPHLTIRWRSKESSDRYDSPSSVLTTIVSPSRRVLWRMSDWDKREGKACHPHSPIQHRQCGRDHRPPLPRAQYTARHRRTGAIPRVRWSEGTMEMRE